jgi:hypothetical protein
MDFMLKRRRHKRVDLEATSVQAKTFLTSDCRILDMGLQGVRVATTQWLNLDNEYSIKFNINGRQVFNRGTVRWARLVGNQKGRNQDSIPIYMTGIEFSAVLTDKAKDIIGVLDEYSEDEEKRFSGQRLQIKTPVKAVFNVLREYPIRQISSGGMLVETDHELQQDKILSWAFNFPDDVNIIRCRGRVISCRRTVLHHRKRYSVGIEFIDLQQVDRVKLARFIMKAMCSELKTSLVN